MLGLEFGCKRRKALSREERIDTTELTNIVSGRQRRWGRGSGLAVEY
jgi:hypothetical protein